MLMHQNKTICQAMCVYMCVCVCVRVCVRVCVQSPGRGDQLARLRAYSSTVAVITAGRVVPTVPTAPLHTVVVCLQY